MLGFPDKCGAFTTFRFANRQYALASGCLVTAGYLGAVALLQGDFLPKAPAKPVVSSPEPAATHQLGLRPVAHRLGSNHWAGGFCGNTLAVSFLRGRHRLGAVASGLFLWRALPPAEQPNGSAGGLLALVTEVAYACEYHPQ